MSDSREATRRARAPEKSGHNELATLWQDIYKKSRPYLVEIGKDFLISLILYAILFVFEGVFDLLPWRHQAGDFFIFLHSVALISLLAVFGWLSIIDVIHIHRREAV